MKIVITLAVIAGFVGIMNFVGKTSLEIKSQKTTQITPFDSHGANAGELWKQVANN